MESVPEFLYRYEPPEDIRLKSLRLMVNHTRQLWFSKPCCFDDPKDCNFRVDGTVTIEDAEYLYPFFSKALTVEQKALWQNCHLENERPTVYLIRMLQESFDLVFNSYLETARGQRGILCLSAQRDIERLWLEYARNATGYCLEFDSNYWPFKEAHEVKYYSLLPRFSPKSIILESGQYNAVNAILTSKLDKWDYQSEWRIILEEGNKFYFYPGQALTAIYMGKNAVPDLIEKIRSILEGSETRLYGPDGTLIYGSSS